MITCRTRRTCAVAATAISAISAITAAAAHVHESQTGGAPVLRLTGAPSGLVASPDNRTLYLADASADAITPVSAATGKAGRPIPITGGGVPVLLAFTADGRSLRRPSTASRPQVQRPRCGRRECPDGLRGSFRKAGRGTARRR
jgi:hypothetical protein